MKITAAIGGLLAALVLSTLAVLTPAPSSAETGVKALPEGDAPAAIDFAQLKARNGEARWRIAVEVSDLRSKGNFSLGWSKSVPRGSKGGG